MRPDLVGQTKTTKIRKKKNVGKILFAFFFQIINRYLMVKKKGKTSFFVWGGRGRIINAMCENIYEGGGEESCVRARRRRAEVVDFFLSFFSFDESGKHCEINFLLFFIWGRGIIIQGANSDEMKIFMFSPSTNFFFLN